MKYLLAEDQDSIEEKRRIAYSQIKNEFRRNRGDWIDRIVKEKNCSLDSAFLFCLFHHMGTEKLNDVNFSSALMEFLSDEKMIEFKSINYIRRFMNDNFLLKLQY